MNDCKGNDTALFIKYADDSAIEDICPPLTQLIFRKLRGSRLGVNKKHLDLNVGNTKEMVVDFRKYSAAVPDLFINGVKVERVTESSTWELS